MASLDVTDVVARVDAAIAEQLERGRADLRDLTPESSDLLEAVAALMTGGKRLRPLFLYLGYRAGGLPDHPGAAALASSVEFVQTAALIHDDVIDRSDTRRGMPTVHKALAAAHRARAWEGDPERFGEAGAILAGNLCLGWADQVYDCSGLPPEHLARARATFDLMRAQLMAGQYLDVIEAARPWRDLPPPERIASATRVITYKSAKYSVQHPLLIGAHAGGVPAEGIDRLSAYGLDVGIAFQLRDDLLGIFGDPEHTGKPAGDDLREGKRTVLIAHSLAGLGPRDARRLEEALGDPGLTDTDIAGLRDLITASGAIAAVEADIDRRCAAAEAALAGAGLPAEIAQDLRGMIVTATRRSY